MGKYIVTGAGGFIGRHLCAELAGAGHDVVAFLHYHAEQHVPDVLRNIGCEIVCGDVRNGDTLEQLPDCDGIYHLAACVDVAWSLQLHKGCKNYRTYYGDVNYSGSLVVAAFAASRKMRMMYMSTSEVYGTPQVIPISESSKLHPQSPYAESKLRVELDLEAEFRASLNYVVVRAFNVFGPGQTTRAVVAKMCEHAARRRDEPIVLGTTTTSRDWTYVLDTARGLRLAMEQGKKWETYNIGTGISRTVESVAKLLGLIVQRDGDLGRGCNEVLMLQADASKARRELGWKPEWEFEAALKATVDSFR